MDAFRRLDVYRKIPKDLTQPTTSGAMISLVCILFISFLLLTEVYTYFTPEVVSELFVDEERQEDPVWVFLNVTFPRLDCDILGLDLQDDLGRHEVGFSQDNVIVKTPITSNNNEQGCRFEGQFTVNRVPGNFHLSTHSAHNSHKQVDLNSIDMSHILHELRFGDKFVVDKRMPGTYAPLKNKNNNVRTPWMSHDYFLRIVPTIIEEHGHKTAFPFQYTYSYKGHVSNHVPAVWFRYDLNPITVKYTIRHQPLYGFFGRTVAYVGGTFTVAGMIDSIVFSTTSALKKLELGKLS